MSNRSLSRRRARRLAQLAGLLIFGLWSAPIGCAAIFHLTRIWFSLAR